LLDFCLPSAPLFAFPRQNFGQEIQASPPEVTRHFTITIHKGTGLANKGFRSVSCTVGFLLNNQPMEDPIIFSPQDTPLARGSTPTWDHSILYHINQFPTAFLVIQLSGRDNVMSSGKAMGQVIIPVSELEGSGTKSFQVTKPFAKKKSSSNDHCGHLQITWELSGCPLLCPILTGPGLVLTTQKEYVGDSSTSPLPSSNALLGAASLGIATNNKHKSEDSPGRDSVKNPAVAAIVPKRLVPDEMRTSSSPRKKKEIEDLSKLIRQGEFIEFVKLLENLNPADINHYNDSKQTLLFTAVNSGQLPFIVELLKRPGINPNVLNGDTNYNNSPLHAATMRGNPRCVALLIIHGANPDIKIKNDQGFSASVETNDDVDEVYTVFALHGLDGLRAKWPECANLQIS